MNDFKRQLEQALERMKKVMEAGRRESKEEKEKEEREKKEGKK